MKLSIFLFTFLLLTTKYACFSQEKIIKTKNQWKESLTKTQYCVLREKGTEYAFSGNYNKHYKKGTYHCAGCNTALFNSESKFNSGTGWPSFDRHINNSVRCLEDKKHRMTRTEIVCNVCDGHLGHLFLDGPPKTTGKRYCVNSASLIFIKAK